MKQTLGQRCPIGFPRQPHLWLVGCQNSLIFNFDVLLLSKTFRRELIYLVNIVCSQYLPSNLVQNNIKILSKKRYFWLQNFQSSHKLDDHQPHVASGYRIGHHCSRMSLLYSYFRSFYFFVIFFTVLEISLRAETH